MVTRLPGHRCSHVRRPHQRWRNSGAIDDNRYLRGVGGAVLVLAVTRAGHDVSIDDNRYLRGVGGAVLVLAVTRAGHDVTVTAAIFITDRLDPRGCSPIEPRVR